MSRRLVINDGTRERELQLVGRVVVGRDPTCDISHDHSLLSRRHAEFVTGANGVTVRDLGSRNGVFVNGVKAAERSLSPGDVVQIGPLRALYVTDGVPLAIAPEELDAGRTAMLRSPSPAAARPAAPTPVPEDDEEDDEATRLMRAPVPSAAPPAIDESEEQTRFVRAPAGDEASSTVVIPLAAAAAVSPAPAVSAAPMPVVRESLGPFVFLQLLAFAGVILAAAGLPLLMWRRAVLNVPGAEAGSASLVWLAVPLAVALAATYVVGAAITRRFVRALTAQRNRT